MANMVALAIGACLAALGLFAAISAGLPDWAYVSHDLSFGDYGIKSEYTVGLYKANHHLEMHLPQMKSETDDDHDVPQTDDDNVFDDDGDDDFSAGDDDDTYAYFTSIARRRFFRPCSYSSSPLSISFSGSRGSASKASKLQAAVCWESWASLVLRERATGGTN